MAAADSIGHQKSKITVNYPIYQIVERFHQVEPRACVDSHRVGRFARRTARHRLTQTYDPATSAFILKPSQP
jgi:hypothetical protein